MRFHQGNIVSIEKPVQLFTINREQGLIGVWPMKLLFRQALVIEHKTVVFPEQYFQLVEGAVSEDVENPTAGIVSKLHLHDG